MSRRSESSAQPPSPTLAVALLRAKLVARADAERARRILIDAGLHWRAAGVIVLTARRRGQP